jgi:hypothetical protein
MRLKYVIVCSLVIFAIAAPNRAAAQKLEKKISTEAVEVKRILDKTISLYAHCSSYKDSGKVVVEEKYRTKTDITEVAFNTAFIRNKGFRLITQKVYRKDWEPDIDIIWYDYKGVKLYDPSLKLLRKTSVTSKDKMEISPSMTGGNFDSPFLKIPDLLNIVDDTKGGFIPTHVEASIANDMLDSQHVFKITFPLGSSTSTANDSVEPETIEKRSMTIWLDKSSSMIIKIEEKKEIKPVKDLTHNNATRGDDIDEKALGIKLKKMLEKGQDKEIVKVMDDLKDKDNKSKGPLLIETRTYFYKPVLNGAVTNSELEFAPPIHEDNNKNDAPSQLPQ